MPAGMALNILTKSGKILKHDHIKTKKTIPDPGTDKLAVFHGDLKRLTSLTSIPNIVLNTVHFYSA